MASRYGWIVTIDHDAQRARKEGFPQDDEAGTIGPRNIGPHMTQQLQAGRGKVWRAYDGDDELMYTGRYIGPDDESMFGPLEDFATPNVGATSIKYKSGRGAWETL